MKYPRNNKRKMRKCCQQLLFQKIYSLNETDKLIDKYNLLKLA